MKLIIGLKAIEKYCGFNFSEGDVDKSIFNKGTITNPKQH